MLQQEIFTIKDQKDFLETTLKVFRFQYQNNPVYKRFCDLLNCEPQSVTSLEQIPFLPVDFFKSHKVLASNTTPEVVFSSSGTTGSKTSKHYVSDLNLYKESFLQGFQTFYGKPEDLVILALLPSYLEREGSSLIYMVEELINISDNPDSGFYLNNLEQLQQKLKVLDQQGKKCLLIGVSFALLDLIEMYDFQLKNTIVMETGGMKGRRKEMIRQELHNILKIGFGVEEIHSEYGMTELLSQAYSDGEGVFTCPAWMQILIRDPEDALSYLSEPNKTGGINVIDLANINSCSFIATQDLGKKLISGKTEILGRFDNSDIRGCNLLIL